MRVRCGIITPGSKPIRGRTVDDYLCIIGVEISIVMDEGNPHYGND